MSKTDKNLLKPHIFVKNINKINFSYLKKQLGINYIVFDKDDTLTLHNCNKICKMIKHKTLQKIIKIFGENTFICSNSTKNWKIDWKKKSLKKEIKQNRSFKKIYTTNLKKPFNFEEILSQMEKRTKRKKIQPEEICFIGDRILTDVLIARQNNCFSILVEKFSESDRSLMAKFFGKIESLFFKKKFVLDSVVFSVFKDVFLLKKNVIK